MVFAIKVIIGALIAVLASEAAKRSTALGAMIITLPLTSMLAMTFLYHDTKSLEKVGAFAKEIPLAVLPSFLFFFMFAWLAKLDVAFPLAMLLSTGIMLAGYVLYWKLT